MRFAEWIILKKRVEPKPTKRVWGLFFIRKIAVRLEDLPLKVWLQLKDVKFDIEYAPYILGIYLDIDPVKVLNMSARRVIAIYRHVREQVKKCNNHYKDIMSIVLEIQDGIDKTYLQKYGNLLMIYDLANKNILEAEKVENIKLSIVFNWICVKNALLRYEQERLKKEKEKYDSIKNKTGSK